jgi:hypothetical protein
MKRTRRLSITFSSLVVLAACSGGSSSTPAATDQSTVSAVGQASDDSTNRTSAASSDTEPASSDATIATPTTTAEAVIEVATQPGSGDFVGAREDVTAVTCEQSDGVWRAAGTATNPTDTSVNYRIYVSYLDPAGETLALIEHDIDGAEPSVAGEWSTEFTSDVAEMQCILRVERAAL